MGGQAPHEGLGQWEPPPQEAQPAHLLSMQSLFKATCLQ